jgi:Domain of unknown function (DUF4143)
VLWGGGYPRIHQERLDPREWLDAYVTTYLERDVRDVVNVGDLVAFQTFLRLCAGRVGQLVNLSALAAECGVSQPTARRWLSVLEAGFVVFRLPPFHANLGKRLVKTPKLYFNDSGLAANLLGIDRADQLATQRARTHGDRPRDRGRRRPDAARGEGEPHALLRPLRRVPDVRHSTPGTRRRQVACIAPDRGICRRRIQVRQQGELLSWRDLPQNLDL